MITKAIWVLIFLVIGFIGYLLFQQWDQVRLERESGKKEQAAAVVNGDNLPGMPYQLDSSYRTAKANGPVTFRAWLAANEGRITDPRKAWIQLELCVAMTRESPAEAKKIFAGVKSRVPPSSPVWSRVKELEKTFE
jgi:hypothetical protein